MDHHALAAISIAGISLDVLGGLYLAYDLLGGQHGPLRLLTRMVTYSIVFGIGYSLGLGILFGLASGAATGLTVSLELHRTASNRDYFPLRWEALFSLIRGCAFGAGLYPLVGLPFAMTFGVIISAGQIFAYSQGIRPSLDYMAARHMRLTRRQAWAVLWRTSGAVATALFCSASVRHLDHPWSFALHVGVVIGLVTAVGTLLNPYIEYYADNLPARRLGVFGIGLVLCGFALQSVQYWLAMLDVPLR